MAESGAQPGNQNAAKGKIISDAIRKALADEDWKRLRAGSEKVADAYAAGEPWAVNFVADRMEGKAAQSMTLAGDPEKPLIQRIERTIIDSTKPTDT